MTTKDFFLTMLVATALTGCATTKHDGPSAAVSESFDYPVGTMATAANGGSGFVGGWEVGGFNTSGAEYEIASGSLSYPGIKSRGNRLMSGAQSAITGMRRSLAAPLYRSGKPAYLSFLVRPEGTLNAGALAGFFGLGIANQRGNEVFFGKPGAGDMKSYVIEGRGGADQESSGSPVGIGETALLVIKIEDDGGGQKFSLYVNPKDGQEPKEGTVATLEDLGAGGQLMIYSTGAFSLDEIRVGDSIASVTK